MKRKPKKMIYAFGMPYRTTLFAFISLAAGFTVLITGLQVLESQASEPPEPVITSFAATPASAPAGQKATLAWTAQNSDVCHLSNTSVLTFPAEAKYTFVLKETKTYTLTCYAGDLQTAKTLTVGVEPGAAR